MGIIAWAAQSLTYVNAGPAALDDNTRAFILVPVRNRTGPMSLSERVKSNMEAVLDEVCRELPNGGDHEVRKRIAEHLLSDLRAAGLRACATGSKWPKRNAQ